MVSNTFERTVSSTEPSDGESGKEGGVARAAQGIRSMIAERRLLPGEQLRQEELARNIGMSRGTIREALQVLNIEKLVTYHRNRGYTVARFDAGEMAQLYELRDFAERLLLESIQGVTKEDLEPLIELNEQIRASADDAHEVVRLNDTFHALLFDLSPLHVVRDETMRWWQMSAAYRALSVAMTVNRLEIAKDHDRMLEALLSGSKEELVAHAFEHRHKSLSKILPTLS